MRLSNGFVIDKEKTFGELKFTAVRDVFLQNEDGTPSTQLKKRIYDLKCSLHGGIIPVSVPPEVPLREFPYNAVVELVNPVADTVSRKTYTNSRGIRSLDIFSIPAVPWLMIYAVKNKKMKGKMTAPCKGNVPSAPSRLFRK